MSVVQETPRPEQSPGQPVALPASMRRLRVWPAVAIVVLGLAATWLPGFIAPATPWQFMAMFFGPMATAALVAIWWLAASRASWCEKLAGLALFAAVGAATAF